MYENSISYMHIFLYFPQIFSLLTVSNTEMGDSRHGFVSALWNVALGVPAHTVYGYPAQNHARFLSFPAQIHNQFTTCISL